MHFNGITAVVLAALSLASSVIASPIDNSHKDLVSRSEDAKRAVAARNPTQQCNQGFVQAGLIPILSGILDPNVCVNVHDICILSPKSCNTKRATQECNQGYIQAGLVPVLSGILDPNVCVNVHDICIFSPHSCNAKRAVAARNPTQECNQGYVQAGLIPVLSGILDPNVCVNVHDICILSPHSCKS